jgi:hypothetical protein
MTKIYLIFPKVNVLGEVDITTFDMRIQQKSALQLRGTIFVVPGGYSYLASPGSWTDACHFCELQNVLLLRK